MLENLFFVNCVDSTNDLIKKYPANTAIIAERQMNGRGRYGKTWLSNKGGLYFTYKKNINSFQFPDPSGFCALAIGMACHLALNNEKNKLYLKWPNDLLNEDFEKIAGILIEVSEQNYLIGIGLNTAPIESLSYYKTSNSNLFLAKLIIEQIDLISHLEPKEIIEYWNKYISMKKGEYIKADFPDGSQVEGEMEKLGDNGELYLKTKERIISLRNAMNIRSQNFLSCDR